jgi:hypothetical protein
MSVIETRQQALEGKMSQVLATTAANTEALHELKLVFTRYITKLKDTSDVSPSMSKSAIDSDGERLAQAIKPTAPTEVACSEEAADDATNTLDFDSEDATPTEGKKHPTMLPNTTKRGPSPAPVAIPVQPKKAELAAPQTKEVVLQKPELLGAKLKAADLKVVHTEEPISNSPTYPAGVSKAKQTTEKGSVPIVKDAAGKKGSQEQKTGSGDGDSTAGAMLEAADKLLEAAKMRVDSFPGASTGGPSPKKTKKQRQPSPPKVDAPALDAEEASTQVSSDDKIGPPKSPLTVQKSKLLVLNVHGTLLDCSLLEEPNPNSTIRYTFKTPTRRVVCVGARI